MKIQFIFAAFILFFTQTNCTRTTDLLPPIEEPTTEDTTTESSHFTYLALGDSYTIGQSVPTKMRYPVQIIDSLFPNNDNAEVKIIARTGWATDDLIRAIDNETDLANDYDFVSLLIGVNNQYRNYPIEDYNVQFKQLLNKAIAFAGNDKNKVFVVSIPDYAYTSFGGGSQSISEEIDEYNEINKEITDDLGIQYFDITPISREGFNDPELVANDGLHPSGKQYTEWVKLMLPVLRAKIE